MLHLSILLLLLISVFRGQGSKGKFATPNKIKIVEDRPTLSSQEYYYVQEEPNDIKYRETYVSDRFKAKFWIWTINTIIFGILVLVGVLVVGVFVTYNMGL